MAQRCLHVMLAIASVFVCARGVAGWVEPPTMAQAESLMQAAKYTDAAAVFQQVVEAQPGNAVAWVRFGRALLQSGDYARAVEVETKAAGMPNVKHRAMFNLACAYAQLGDKGRAMKSLEVAVASGLSSDATIENEPLLAPLHDQPAYAAILETMRAANDKPEYHALDFWVGSWDVYDAQGNLIGKNRIESQERGCLIAEHWIPVGAGGAASATGSGRSMNFFDPKDSKWKQVWVNDGGNVLYLDGKIVEDGVWFEGDAYTRRGGIQHSRTVLGPLPNRRVRQSIHFTSDGGKTWAIAFDAVYVPAGEKFGADQFPATPPPGGG